MNSKYTVRRATEADLLAIKRILEAGKRKMRANGNMKQWTGNYPSDEILQNDLKRGASHVVLFGPTIVATFVLAIGEDPTYRNIYEGQWLNDILPYGTIHRIASLEGYRGIGHFVFDWSFKQINNLRVDTHRDNTPMRQLLIKEGFTYCGIIYLLNGDERLAYQQIKKQLTYEDID